MSQDTFKLSPSPEKKYQSLPGRAQRRSSAARSTNGSAAAGKKSDWRLSGAAANDDDDFGGGPAPFGRRNDDYLRNNCHAFLCSEATLNLIFEFWSR